MSLLAAACLNPAFCLLPDKLPPVERLEYWLNNPLLLQEYPGRMKVTRELATSFTTDAEREAMISRLETARAPLKWKYSRFDDSAPSDWQMNHLFSHELINGKERGDLVRYRKSLAVQEWAQLKEHVENVLRVRELALEQQRELAAQQQSLDFDTEQAA